MVEKKNIKDRGKYKPRYLDIYKVQKGDTFESISRKFYQVDRHGYEIATINGIKENNILLSEGLVLKIIRDGVYQTDKSNNIKSDSGN